MKQKISYEGLYFCNLFEKITHTRVKDCFGEENLTFVVCKNNAAKAIGKGGVNVKKMKNLFKKNIQVVEYDEDPVKFVKNLIFPIVARTVEKQENTIEVSADTQTKALLIGRNRKRLDYLNSILHKYFKFDLRIK